MGFLAGAGSTGLVAASMTALAKATCESRTFLAKATWKPESPVTSGRGAILGQAGGDGLGGLGDVVDDGGLDVLDRGERLVLELVDLGLELLDVDGGHVLTIASNC